MRSSDVVSTGPLHKLACVPLSRPNDRSCCKRAAWVDWVAGLVQANRSLWDVPDPVSLGESAMTRPARRTLSTVLVMAMAVGALLLGPPQAAAGPNGHAGTAAPASQRLDPDQLQPLLDQVGAAGAPGAAQGWPPNGRTATPKGAERML